MSDGQLSASQRILVALREAREKIQRLEKRAHEPIAIVGMSCRLPGGANSPEQFWKNLIEKKDGIKEIPSDRWDIDAYYDPDPAVPGKMSTRLGGFVDEIDLFDPEFFRISPREAISMDPQHRLLLELCWEALERSGEMTDRLSASNTGVFIGITAQDYQQIASQARKNGDIGVYEVTGNSLNAAAGRISYVLGFQGPAMIVDTACSSSLVSIHLACQSLRQQECDRALAGGVNLILSPEGMVATSRGRMLAADGHCKTFDAAADGYVRGEGCGVIVLKRLEDAIADGDKITAVIIGSAVNHDGPSSGLTVPNGRAQQKLIQEALRVARIKPTEVSYIEAHGTGTSLGDPIEMDALKAVFGKAQQEPLTVASVKTNIGHLESAAGVAGVIKVALSLQNKEIPAHLNFKEPNKHIDWDSWSVKIPTETERWVTKNDRRIAGISSFGVSGTNAHLLLAEPAEIVDEPKEMRGSFFVLSAQNEESLLKLATDYLNQLDQYEEKQLVDICWTAATGRVHFSHRLALWAESKRDLEQKLHDFIQGKESEESFISGRTSSNFPPTIEQVKIDAGNWQIWAKGYVGGSEINWKEVVSRGKRLVLPQYPFSRSRYWISDFIESVNEKGEIESGNPLLGKRLHLAGKDQIYFETELRAHSPLFLQDHQLWGQVVFPGTGYIEIVLSGGKTIFGTSQLVIQDLLWHQPLMLFSDQLVTLQTVFTAENNGYKFSVYTFIGEDEPILHVTGTIFKGERTKRANNNVTELTVGKERVDQADLYKRYAQNGIQYGQSFQRIERLFGDESGSCAQIRQNETNYDFQIDPAVLDSCFQAIGAVFSEEDDQAVFLPINIEQLELQQIPDGDVWVDIKVRFENNSNKETVIADLKIYDNEQSKLLMQINGLTLKRADSAQMQKGYQRNLVDLFYQMSWIKIAPPENKIDSLANEEWYLFVDEFEKSQEVRDMLVSLGATVTVVLLGKEYSREDLFIRLNPTVDGAFNRLWGESDSFGENRERKILYGWGAWGLSSLDGAVDLLYEQMQFATGSLISLWKSLPDSWQDQLQINILSRYGVFVAGDKVVYPWQSAIWGLGRVLQQEHPNWQIKLLDINSDDLQVEPVKELLDAASQENQLVYRGNDRYVARLTEYRRSGEEEKKIYSDGIYLVTGGLGDLGLEVADELVVAGARQLILNGRRPARPQAEQLIERWRALGIEVTIFLGDLADQSTVMQLMEKIKGSGLDLRGVVHAAGVLADGLMVHQSWAQFMKVMGPKVAGSWHLHQSVDSSKLDFFISFSSTASTLGSMAQSNYAFANGFMDGLMQLRQIEGRPGLSINWGRWSEIGLAASLEEQQRVRFEHSGIKGISTQLGRSVLRQLWFSDEAQMLVAPLDWAILSQRYSSGNEPKLLEDLLRIKRVKQAVADQKTNWLEKWKSGSIKERSELVAVYLPKEIGGILHLKEDQILLDKPLTDLGLDSLMAIELRNKVKRDLNLDLPLADLLEGPTIEQLVVQLQPDSEESPPKLLVEHVGQEEFPLSYGQKALWFLYLTEPETPAYNTAVSWQIEGEIDVDLLEKSFLILAKRHEMMRTVFGWSGGDPVQIVLPDVSCEVKIVTSIGWDEKKLFRAVKSAYERPFDLEKGPLFRIHLFKIAENKHIFLLAMHHIVCDAWSLWQLVEEFYIVYNNLINHFEISMPLLKTKYYDFVERQQAIVSTAKGDGLKDYWLDQLAGQLPILNLLADRPYPKVRKHKGDSVPFDLPIGLTKALNKFAREQGTTLFVVLLATYQALLSRYTNQEDIIVGSPVFGRDDIDFAQMVGYLVNILPFRADLSGKPTFLTFLQQVKKTVINGLRHQAYPFPKMIEQLNLERDQSRTPLFQAFFVYQKPQQSSEQAQRFVTSEEAELEIGGWKIKPYEMAQMEGQFDIHLEILEQNNQLRGMLKYHPDLFNRETMERFLIHWKLLLEAIVADAGRLVVDLPIISEQEDRLLAKWNDTAVAYPDLNLPQLFEQMVVKKGRAVAVDFEGETISYQELNQKANQLARYLQKSGLKGGQFVAVCLERSLNLVISLYAVLKAGGAYVPIDPGYPAERVQFMFEDADLFALITDQATVNQVVAYEGLIINLDGARQLIADEGVANLAYEITPDATAYMIYTSGSTGRPKGALNSHRGIVNRLLWMQEAYQLQSDDRVLQKTPFSFDVSVWEFFWPLISGAQLVVARPGGHKDAHYLRDLIEEKEITTIHFVPSMLQLFLSVIKPGEAASLRRVICSGEALSYDLQERYYSLFERPLYNLYGPTEAAIDVTAWECIPGDKRVNVPIGMPVANTEIHILDSQMKRVPIGVPGELYIGGVQVGQGYHNRSELSEARFIPTPFAENGKVYRTGDLARWTAEGVIEYLGRLDFQIKIRGFRIELGEIEAHLLDHRAIKEAVVIPYLRGEDDTILVGYLVAQAGSIDLVEMKDRLRLSLPDYMIPSELILLDRLPVTANGKLDRSALPVPSLQKVEREIEISESGLELQIAQLWQELLGLDTIGRNENFFELGGHSLLLGHLRLRLEETVGQLLPMTLFFKYPTIATMAKYIGKERNSDDQTTLPSELSANREEVVMGRRQKRRANRRKR